MTNMAAQPGATFLCADCSREVGEQIFATAPRCDVWMLIEYTGGWGNQALPESALQQPVIDSLQTWQASTPNAKILFIRRSAAPENEYNLYVALSREEDPVLYRVPFAQHHHLQSFDLDGLSRGESRFKRYRVAEPLFIVCTNGRRDLSCARYGPPVFTEFERAGVNAWQSTHIGGHRFAATVAMLPWGVCYGYINPQDVSDVIVASQRGDVVLEHFRGRSCYEKPTLAADHYLREHLGLRALPGTRLLREEQSGDSEWLVRLETLAGGTMHDVRVHAILSEWETCENSGQNPEMKHMPQFELVDLRTID